MNVKAIVVAISAVLLVAQAQDTNPIDWQSIVPIQQVPGFLDNYPFLRLLLSLFASSQPVSSGNEAAQYRFPWVAGLALHYVSGTTFCSASVISNNTLLTAAHCLRHAASGVAILGAHHIQNGSEPGQRRIFFERQNMIIHPMYFPDSLDHDLALIILDEEIPFDDQIRAIRLPNERQVQSDFQNQVATLAGWGRSLFDWTGGPIRDHMRYVEGSVLSHIRCYANFPTLVSRDQICTRSDNFLGACPGDSGSGFHIVEADGEPTLIGVVNFMSAIGCEANRATVSTRVGRYIEWIAQAAGIPVRPDF